MERLPELHTERLLLRAFTLDDAPAVQTLAGAREVADTTLNIPHPYPDGSAHEWIATHSEGVRNDRHYPFALVRRSDKALIGAIGLRVNRQHNHAELGYWIGVPYWGQGYATEAARRVIAFGFEALDLNRIFAGYFVRNPASRRVQEKAGMRFEGIHRQNCLKSGVYEDIGLCAIIRTDWDC